MALGKGVRLGSYEIQGPLGAGGMGEVYRARDSRLGRDVAIKILPSELIADAERRARFEREARVLAGLSHPAIATLHGLEEAQPRDAAGGVGERMPFLVMELVEGEDLAARLRRGSLPLPDALALLDQVADGLEAAHASGVVHRDLKPANLMIDREGRARILDFGLAKALREPAADALLSSAETETLGPTRAGQVLGTLAYMSPEQIRGEPADRRTDVWAFGCVLFEALTGRHPFGDGSASDRMAAVLKDPPPWHLLPEETPAPIRRLLRRALEKDPKKRLRDIGDARLEIEDALSESSREKQGSRRRLLRTRPARLGGVAVTVALLATVAWVGARMATVDNEASVPDPRRFTIALEPGLRLHGGHLLEDQPWNEQQPSRHAFALSPDGEMLVLAATGPSGRHLYRRRLDQPVAVPIAGTEGGNSPFFSPDGRWLGFARPADRSRDVAAPSFDLARVPVGGGAVEILGRIAGDRSPNGVSWGRGQIALGSGLALWSVPEAGGEAEVLLEADAEAGEIGVGLPSFLPDGETLLYTVLAGPRWTDAAIRIRKPGSGSAVSILENATDGRYSPTGHLLFVRSGVLMASPFEARTERVLGPPVPVTQGVFHALYRANTQLETGAALFAAGSGGLLLFASGDVGARQQTPLVLVDPGGSARDLGIAGSSPRVSPGGERIAFVKWGAEADLWVFDRQRGVADPLRHAGIQTPPAWSPDGAELAFSSDHEGPISLYARAADGSDRPRLLARTGRTLTVGNWTGSGWISMVEANRDVLVLRVDADGVVGPEPYLATDAMESWPAISPNERWMAYASNHSGRAELYVRAFPKPGAEIRVSTEGGVEPVWSRDGRRLFFRQNLARRTRMLVVDVPDGDASRAGPPRVVFEDPGYQGSGPANNYDITPEGAFVMVKNPVWRPRPVTHLEVVLDWRSLTREGGR